MIAVIIDGDELLVSNKLQHPVFVSQSTNVSLLSCQFSSTLLRQTVGGGLAAAQILKNKIMDSLDLLDVPQRSRCTGDLTQILVYFLLDKQGLTVRS